MNRAVMAAFAMLALIVAIPTSQPARAAPVPAAASAASSPSLITQAHSARWHYIRRAYGPRPYWGARPYYGRRHYWHRRAYWGPRPYYRRHHWRPHHWHRGWRRW